MIHRVLMALGVSITIAAAGLLGAYAFNPDGGVVAHSEVLWRIFGIPAEVAWVTAAALAVVLLLALLAALVCRGVRLVRH